MAQSKEWDLRNMVQVANALEWLRKRSGAVILVAIRQGDVSWALDPTMTPADVADRIHAEIPIIVNTMLRKLEDRRQHNAPAKPIHRLNRGVVETEKRGDAWEAE